MRVISLLRSAVAGPRQRPIGALAILTVIFGVVTMHSMSGSPTSHVHAVPHEAPVVATEQAAARSVTTDQVATAQGMVAATTTEQLTASAVVLPVAETPDGHAAHEQGPCEGCCGDGLATAMCLMILVAILALAVPARRLLWRAPLALATSLTSALAGIQAVSAPSLHELCISRT